MSFRSFFRRSLSHLISFSRNRPLASTFRLLALGSIPLGYLGFHSLLPYTKVHALKGKKKEDEVKSIKLSSRERRFLRFASVEYDGQLYMTPQDFLESVVEAEPRPRLKRRTLSKADLEFIRDHTPQVSKGSSQMFRNLRDKGENDTAAAAAATNSSQNEE